MMSDYYKVKNFLLKILEDYKNTGSNFVIYGFSLSKSPKDQAAKSWTHVRFQVRPKKNATFQDCSQKVAFVVYKSKDYRWLAEPRTSMFLCI